MERLSIFFYIYSTHSFHNLSHFHKIFNMGLHVQALAIVTLLVLIQKEGNSIPNTLHQNGTSHVSQSFSPWLNKVVQRRFHGCHGRASLCNKGKFPLKFMCCRNRCVNVTYNKNNCGLCGHRCPYNWQCCRGLCINTNLSVLNCGKCGHRCPFGVLCFFGMCGYGQGTRVVHTP
ncbi:putative stigma-specific protein Stig1 [Lupinus albus]|uniref:Putative stigma-specific protein Stig1 n=1 Tax=Lupinus albus TaxID=3870 RepID=A0A6A4PBQ0_LUPAL|nr:putative stigma-specific protein Stig1 [Lupinus albus]